MRGRKLFGLVFVALPTLVVAQPTEQVVTVQSGGQSLLGTLMLPEGGPAPVVLLLHGFTGSRNELPIPSTNEGVFVHTAKALAKAGFASLRIDFRGSGESTADITYEKTTFEGQIADALASVDYLAGLPTVDGTQINVIGWSQGGLVATAVAGRSDKVDEVALWQAVGDAKATYGGLLGADSLAKGMAAAPDETIVAKLPWGADVSLNGAFFDGIETLNPMAEIANFKGPLFVSQGMTDKTVLPEVAVAFIASHDGPEELWSQEMDHVFNVFTNVDTLNAMIAATVTFFKANTN